MPLFRFLERDAKAWKYQIPTLTTGDRILLNVRRAGWALGLGLSMSFGGSRVSVEQLGRSLQPQTQEDPWLTGLLGTRAIAMPFPRFLGDVCLVTHQVSPSRQEWPA